MHGLSEKKYVLAKGTKTMCWLQRQPQKDISLSIIKPLSIEDFYWREVSRNWSEKQLWVLNRLSLFEKNRPLEKIPYQFRYKFKCEEPNCQGHDMLIEDWEVMQLYRSMRDKYGEEQGLIKVKEKFLNEICSPERDTYFIVGTVLAHGTWIIIGTFWPPKAKER